MEEKVGGLFDGVNEYNSAVTIWQPTLPRGAGPLYRAVAGAMARAIGDGVLSAGSRLPPQRDLARSLGVTVMTITRAYGEAARRGLIEATVGRGSFVRKTAGGSAHREADLATNVVRGADPG